MSDDDSSDRDRNGNRGGPVLLADLIDSAMEGARGRAVTSTRANDNDGDMDEEHDGPSVLGRAALDLVEAGVIVFPLAPRQKAPALLKRWQEIATADVTQTRAWWAQHPQANIALQCGARSGIVVIDVDGPEGEASLAELEQQHRALPATVEVVTGRGRHLYFAHPGVVVPNGTSRIGHKIDVKADGGYVLAPPSVHPSGAVYQWVPNHSLGETTPADMPDWLLELALRHEHGTNGASEPRPASADEWAQKNRYWLGAVAGEVKNVHAAADGNLNNTLNTAAYKLGGLVAGEGFEPAYARSELLRAALAKGHPERGARASIESGLSSGMKEPLYVPAPQATHYSAGTNGASSYSNGHEKQEATEDATPPATPAPACRIQVVGPETIFAPLPPMRWVSRDLMIAAGRPTLLAAYGSSAKTLAMQSMLLAICSGHRIWNRFEVAAPLRVCHLDYEQGYRDTYYRYQRLSLGHGIEFASIGDRLHVGAMPAVYLTTDGAYDDFSRIAEGHDLVLIDSLRAAAPGVDENESKVRSYIDILTRISDSTGAAFVLIHHAGKSGGDGRDARQLARGSSAIFDACGCVLNLTIGKTGSDPRAVSMTKPPASSEGAAIEAFGLVVQDVANETSPIAGVSVTWKALAVADADEEAGRAYEVDAQRLLHAIAAHPGATQHTVAMRAGMKKARAVDVLKSLDDDRRVSVVGGARGSKTYWPVESKS